METSSKNEQKENIEQDKVLMQPDSRHEEMKASSEVESADQGWKIQRENPQILNQKLPEVLEKIEEKTFIERRTIPVITEVHQQPIVEIREKAISRNVEDPVQVKQFQLPSKEEQGEQKESREDDIERVVLDYYKQQGYSGEQIKRTQQEPVISSKREEKPIIKEIIYKPTVEVREQPIVTEVRTQPFIAQINRETRVEYKGNFIDQVTTLANQYHANLIEDVSKMVKMQKEEMKEVGEENDLITTKTTISTEVFLAKELMEKLKMEGTATQLQEGVSQSATFH